MRLTFLLSLLCLLLPISAQAAQAGPEPVAIKIKLPLPWKQGQVLAFDSERVKTETGPGKREKVVSASKVEVRTIEAGAEGFVQEWRWRDARDEVLEGDKRVLAAMAPAVKEIEAADLPVVVEMDAAGTYQRVRNLDQVGALFRKAMRPVMLSLMTTGFEEASKGQDAATRQQALDKLPAEADALLERTTQPKLLEAMLTRELETLLNFSGAELEDDQSYVLETVLENPTGGAAFPAKLTFGLYVDEDEPEDVYLEWTMTIDPDKGAKAMVDTAERLYGRTFSPEEAKALPERIAVEDKGFIVFERATGLPEMFQNVRTTKFGETANYERNRLRLHGGRHAHEWVEQNPQATEPVLSSDERDAQLCADVDADTLAGIAACSRRLEGTEAKPAQRADWFGYRGWHRYRSKQMVESAGDYDKAIALDPAQARHYLGRSRALRHAGDYPAALADAEKAIALSPQWAFARLSKGFVHEGAGDWARAVAAYDEGLAIAPNDAGLHDARCWAKAMLGDYAGGAADCGRALELDPGSWNSYNSRAYIHYRSGRHAEAVADSDRAIANEPEVASSWHVRGLARRALGDGTGAEADFAKALQLDPGVATRYAGYEAR